MTLKSFFIFLLFACTQTLMAQDFLTQEKNADSLFDIGAYAKSNLEYETLMTLSKNETQKIYFQIKQVNCLIRLNEFERAQRLLSDIDSNVFLKNDINAILLLQSKAQLYHQIGQLENAETFIKLSIEKIRIQHNVSTDLLAESYNILGVIYWMEGKDELATDFFYQSLELRLKSSVQQKNKIAAVYNNLGLVYIDLSTTKAIEFYNQAMALYEKNSFNEPQIAIIYTNIGQAYFKSTDYVHASIFFNKALDIWNVIYTKDHPNKAFLFSSLAQVNLARKEFELAQQQAQAALNIYIQFFGQKHPNTAASYTLLGAIDAAHQKYNSALAYFQKSLLSNTIGFSNTDIACNPPIKNYFDGELLLSTLRQKALTLQQREEEKTLRQKDLLLALSTYFSCDTLINQLRQTRVGKKDKIALGILSNEIYDNGIQICKILSETTLHKKKYIECAFYFSERNKAAVLQEAIADANAKSFGGIPKEALDKETSFKNKIIYLEQRLLNGISDTLELSDVNSQLFQMKRNYESHIKMLENKYPDYYNLKYNVQPISLSQLQQSLGNETALLQYFESESTKQLFLIVVTKKEASLHVLPIKSYYYKYIAGLNNAIQYDTKSTFIKTSAALYKQLIPHLPKKCNHLVIIPDGRMNNIPFECLLFKKVKSDTVSYSQLPYLIREYAISYNYAASLYINQNKHINHSRALLFAPIVFDSTLGMKNLPGTYNEIKILDSILSKQYQTTVLLYDHATKAKLMSDSLVQYDIIQLSTHGEVNLIEPELSCIYTFKDNGLYASQVFTSDIFSMKLNAQLVTLSACQTGIGKITKGEGMIGLSRALLYAGADNIMVSLWKVSDISTQYYMTYFYHNFMQGATTHTMAYDAQTAKLTMINSSFSRPYYWSAFILIGN